MLEVRNLSDLQLVRLLEQKRKEVLAEVYLRTVDQVFRFIYSRTGNRELAQDLTSEVYLSLTELLVKYDGSSKLSTFVIGIALNKLRQYWSRRVVEIPLDDANLTDEREEYSAALEMSDQEHQQQYEKPIGPALQKGLNSLNESERKVVQMLILDGRKSKDVAEQLGITAENLRVIKHRALKQLREYL